MSSWMQIKFQDSASPITEKMIMFHDHSMMIIMLITSMVMYIMMTIIMNKLVNRNLLEAQLIEIIWTSIPMILLLIIALPSLNILYMMEESMKPMLSIKAMGHQWFWSYEYSDYKNIEFDSYMKNNKELMDNEFRLLEVDNRTIIPLNTKTRMMISSYDVIHSWTVPALGVKIDAIPGRINQGNLTIMRTGLFFGQCSEICGANHSFMPIMIESIEMKSFIKWIMNL
uniref:Cytochrome c oxidase subunit 2 n=1 Tax=Cicadellidae gen. sp. 1 JCX-2018 TaxID=2306300 RepID=A0A346RNI8_9HEMI|nr:cytochrome c oxidase subunit II [Cicadellidae gen. sp. 1 JCX-2018]